MADIMDHPLISISIINLNGNNYLNDCLGSLDKLDYPKDKIEILVVDNGSTDDSVKFAERVTEEGLVDVWDLNVATFAEWGEDAGPSAIRPSPCDAFPCSPCPCPRHTGPSAERDPAGSRFSSRRPRLPPQPARP